MSPPLRPLLPRDVPRLLREVAARLRRLSPSHRDPECFHIEKDQIVHDLYRIARALGREPGRG